MDPKHLIRDAFRIDGIGDGECRTIFLDWALGLPPEANVKSAVRALLVKHADMPATHPMVATLQQALDDAAPPRRKGGRAGRLSH